MERQGWVFTYCIYCERIGEVYHTHTQTLIALVLYNTSPLPCQNKAEHYGIIADHHLTTNEMKIFQQIYLQLESVSQLESVRSLLLHWSFEIFSIPNSVPKCKRIKDTIPTHYVNYQYYEMQES